MSLVSVNPDKLLDGLLTLPTQKELREGQFILGLQEGAQPALTYTLTIQLREREAPPMLELAPPKEEPTVRTYQTTSYFLRQCHRQLFAGNPDYERQLLISGASFPERDRHLLDISVPVKLANVSHTGVEAEISDLLQHLADLDTAHGLLLLGVFHSHLWAGRTAVTPSRTDRGLQGNLEREGYHAIQAIFSTDGLVGFFSNSVPFALEVVGTGVEEVETHAHHKVLRLKGVPHIPDQTLHPQASRGAGRL